MNVLLWHVHGSWATAFVQGRAPYLVPTLPERGPWGGGRPAAWDWPASALEVGRRTAARRADVDVVVLQRPEEIELARAGCGAPRAGRAGGVPGAQRPARPGVPLSRHPLADRHDITVVHVTHFNALMWDAARTRTQVIEHGIVDPGLPLHRRAGRGRGGDQRAAAPEPGHRHRPAAPLRRGSPRWTCSGWTGRPGAAARAARAGVRRRPAAATGCTPSWPAAGSTCTRIRWTSLGLSLLEAMQLGHAGARPGHHRGRRGRAPGAGVCATEPARLAARSPS